MKGPTWIVLAGLVAGVATGCGGDADLAGNYTISLTNGANGCNLGNFTPGDTTTGVAVVITQTGSTVTATVNGVAALALAALLGAGKNVYTGSVSGDDMTVESIGTRANTSGNCTYTFNSKIHGTLDGDVLRGTIEYRAAGNGNSDCAQLAGCISVQDYNGTRPPQ